MSEQYKHWLYHGIRNLKRGHTAVDALHQTNYTAVHTQTGELSAGESKITLARPKKASITIASATIQLTALRINLIGFYSIKSELIVMYRRYTKGKIFKYFTQKIHLIKRFYHLWLLKWFRLI